MKTNSAFIKTASRVGLLALLSLSVILPMSGEAFAANSGNNKKAATRSVKKIVQKKKAKANVSKKASCKVALQARTRAGCFQKVNPISEFY